jgi:hypothetical protein
VWIVRGTAIVLLLSAVAISVIAMVIGAAMLIVYLISLAAP